MEGPGPQTVDDHSPTRGHHPIARFLHVTIGRISGLLAFLGYQQARHLVRRVAGKLLCLLVSISLLAYLFHKVPLSQVFDVVTAARPAPLTAALLIALSSQLISAVRLKRLADAYGLDLSTFEVLQINFATRFYGLFLPAGNLSGNAIRFYKMSKPQKAYGGTAVSLFLDRMATTIALCVVGIAFWLLAIPAGPFPLLVLMFTALTVLLAVQAMLFIELPLPMLTGLRRRLGRQFPKYLETVPQAVRQAHPLPRGTLVHVFGLSILTHLIGIVAYSLVAESLGLDISFVTIGWIRSVAVLIAILPLSIGGLGVREGTLLVLLTPYGIAAADALAFSLLVFAATILTVALLGALFEAKRWLL